jgi:hypothetical protein
MPGSAAEEGIARQRWSIQVASYTFGYIYLIIFAGFVREPAGASFRESKTAVPAR